MNELIQALTRAANAVAVYYEKESGMTGKDVAAPEAAPTEPKVRKPRAPKVETRGQDDVPGEPETSRPAAPASDMTEEQSLKEVRAVAKTYVQRFANQVDGIAAFRKLMSDTCMVGKIDDLVHAQRLRIINVARAEIANAVNGGKPAPLTASAGVEV